MVLDLWNKISNPIFTCEAASNNQMPIPDSSYSNSLFDSTKHFFIRNLVDKLSDYKNKIFKHFKSNITHTQMPKYPTGIYPHNGVDYHNVLPRVEILPSGTEYYIAKKSKIFLKSDK